MLLASFILSTCLAAEPSQKTYYTNVNIWYEDPEKILSTNYHRGAIIPFCSKVEIISQSKNKIIFTSEDVPGVTFTLINVPRHSMVTTGELFKQYFIQDGPKDKNVQYSKFTQQEKDNIENGTLTTGMSKEAVIAAYGYPPKHKTPVIASNLWTYWDARGLRKLVTFKNNQIINLEEVKENLESRPPWYYYVP